MTLLRDDEAAFLRALSALGYCNPFLPERIAWEREALGPEFIDSNATWNLDPVPRSDPKADDDRPNLSLLREKAQALASALAERLAGGVRPRDAELRRYEDLVLFSLYHDYRAEFRAAIEPHAAAGAEAPSLGAGPAADQPASGSAPPAKPPRRRVGFYARFARDARRWFDLPGYTLPTLEELPHLFACLFQVRRAFHHTFRYLIGASAPAARLRAAVWESIFTHDMRRYRRSLYRRMADFTTLITGPSGAGKELVARAIGLSGYVPFDPRKECFAEATGAFFALNLSALSPTLIESELFGHRRGAFTGAGEDRAGWLEVCPPGGTVFLDEIGELDPAIQVKLLRVLQDRTFQRLGETRDRRFAGKIIAATNRDLAADLSRHSGGGGWGGGAGTGGAAGASAGRAAFRPDFYYRLCSDLIAAPSLRERLADTPAELSQLLLHIARREFGGEDAEAIAAEVARWVHDHLGPDYPWPGNVRELTQCVRNVVIRRAYHPPAASAAEPGDEADDLTRALAAGELTADALLRRYCTLVYAQTRHYGKTAARLGLDRRTVKAKIEWERLGEGEGGSLSAQAGGPS